MSDRIYLDHAAATPVCAEAVSAMATAMTRWANPSSQHREGRAARAALEDARERIKMALGWRHELIFTSGATEAARLALNRVAGHPPAIVSPVEHSSVLGARSDARVAAIGADGLVDEEVLAALLGANPGAVVAIQHVNSETGVVQPIGELIEFVDAAGGLVFADCAQSAGKLPLPHADLIGISAHKFGGPPGVGALLVRDLAMLRPRESSQEMGYRPGTENLPAILGFAAAAETSVVGLHVPDWIVECYRWRVALDRIVRGGGGRIICDTSLRHSLIASYRLPGISAAAQLIRLDAAGFAVSAGSACSSGAMKPSHVLTALGMEAEDAGETIRVSFGRTTTEDEVHRFGEAWGKMATEIQARA